MKTAVITGATKGIGLAIAEKFAEEGFSLFVCSRTEDDLGRFREKFAEKYPESQIFTKAVDLSRKEEVLGFAKNVQEHFKKIDVLVNNAGVFIPGAIHEEPDGNLEKMIETNLYSAYHLTRALLPNILAKNSGHIFNICSVASIIAYPNGGSYSISKFALLGFNKCLREELKDKGIKVTAILPGATWSYSWRNADFPHSRLMEAEDIAQATLSAYKMGPSAVVEEILIRPQLGDL